MSSSCTQYSSGLFEADESVSTLIDRYDRMTSLVTFRFAGNGSLSLSSALQVTSVLAETFCCFSTISNEANSNIDLMVADSSFRDFFGPSALMDQYFHPFSVNATIMTKKRSIKGEQAVIISSTYKFPW